MLLEKKYNGYWRESVTLFTASVSLLQCWLTCVRIFLISTGPLLSYRLFT